MDERQRKILAKAYEQADNPLAQAIVEHAEMLAEETLADSITLNGKVIYQKG